MLAGIARATITPPPRADLSGYAARVQPSVGVHDDLYARALYLASGDAHRPGAGRVLWLHADLLGFSRTFAQSVRSEISRELRIPLHAVCLSATHTHSGPATLFLRGCGRVDPDYLDALRTWLKEAARAALADAEPVAAAFAEGAVALSVDRRAPSPRSHTDSRLPALVFRRAGGDAKAVLVNYPVHNVALSHGNRLVSADMAGVAAQVVREGLAGNPEVLLTNGACGNLNPPVLSATFEAAERFGRVLGGAALHTARQAAAMNRGRIVCRELTLSLPLQVPTREEVRADFAAMESAPPSGEAGADGASPMRQWRDDALAALAGGRAPAPLETSVQVIRIGEVFFVCLGAEVFSRMADALRAAGGARTYVVGYANGDLGYLPPEDIHGEGGYEVDMAYRYYGLFMPKRGGFEQVRDAARTLLQQLADAKT
jgi:neutral ceramidase